MKKSMMMIVVASVLYCLTGCATVTYHDKFKTVSSERNEFSDFDEKYILYKGTLSPVEVTRNGLKYNELQFRDVLAGNGRFLNILIPVKSGTDPVIYEASAEIKTGKTAYLFFERSCCTDEYREVLDPVNSREVENDSELMKKIIREKFAESAGSDSPVFICRMVFSNVYNYDLIYQVWRPYPGGTPLFDSGYYLQQPYSTIDVKWRERSRVKTAAVKAGYVLPVALDIVTSPIQLVGVIIYFAAGGAVR